MTNMDSRPVTVRAVPARGAVALRPAVRMAPSSTGRLVPGVRQSPTTRQAPLSPTDPAAARGSAGAGAAFAADPEQVSKGARHLELISELVADIARKAQSVRIHPEGDGPIATAIRTNFTPAKISSDEFLLGLRKLLNFHSAQTTNLSRVLTTVDLSATEAARSVGRRR